MTHARMTSCRVAQHDHVAQRALHDTRHLARSCTRLPLADRLLSPVRAAMTATPAVRVLTDAPLFDCVTSFMTGWPQLVVAFHRVTAPTYSNATAQSHTFGSFEPSPQSSGFLVHIAIATNNMRVLETLAKLREHPHYRSMSVMSFSDALGCAAYFGRLEMLTYLAQTLSCDPAWTWEPRLLVSALRSSQPSLEVLEWLCAHAPAASLEHYPWETARHFEQGNADVVRFLHCYDLAFPRFAIDSAAGNGHLDIVEFLHVHWSEGCTTDAMDYAAANDYFDVVRFLHEHRSEGCTTRAMDSAALNGHLDVVQFLHEHRTEGCTTDAIDYAAREGHLDVIQFLFDNRSEGCTAKAMDHAVAGGHAAVVEFLQARGVERSTAPMRSSLKRRIDRRFGARQ